ncbi:alpha-galactosidase [Acetivibrio clariflavus]|nr:alpha-galactosidase [Acetivibrio clariflavus]
MYEVNKIGLKFGICFCLEIIPTDSYLYRSKPDWCIHVERKIGSLILK